MKVYNFDLLAYPEVPEDVPGTPVPSSYFDPPVGSRNYREHLDEMAYCEELGFEGVVSTSTTTAPTAPCRRPTSSPRR